MLPKIVIAIFTFESKINQFQKLENLNEKKHVTINQNNQIAKSTVPLLLIWIIYTLYMTSHMTQFSLNNIYNASRVRASYDSLFQSLLLRMISEN